MATVTEVISLSADTPTSAPKELVGPKEVFIGGPQAYSKTEEEKGTKHQPAAKYPNYLPIWDPDTK